MFVILRFYVIFVCYFLLWELTDVFFCLLCSSSAAFWCCLRRWSSRWRRQTVSRRWSNFLKCHIFLRLGLNRMSYSLVHVDFKNDVSMQREYSQPCLRPSCVEAQCLKEIWKFHRDLILSDDLDKSLILSNVSYAALN